MQALHSLCSSSTSLPKNLPLNNPHQLANKPSSSLTLLPKTLQSELPLPLPDLPDNVKEKILALEIMGIDSGRVLAHHPNIRAISLDTIHSIISYLLSKGIHHKDLPRIFGICPKLLTCDISSDLVPVFNFLSRDLKVPDKNFRKVIVKCPRLLTCSVRDQLRPALIYLQRLGLVDTQELGYQHPILLASNVERTLIPKLRYLMEIGLSREEVVGMVQRCPGLFTFSIEKNFKPKYDYFVNEMGRRLEELKEFPQYFTFSLDKRIKPRHEEMKRRGRLSVPISVMLKSTDEEFKLLLLDKKV